MHQSPVSASVLLPWCLRSEAGGRRLEQLWRLLVSFAERPPFFPGPPTTGALPLDPIDAKRLLSTGFAFRWCPALFSTSSASVDFLRARHCPRSSRYAAPPPFFFPPLPFRSDQRLRPRLLPPPMSWVPLPCGLLFCPRRARLEPPPSQILFLSPTDVCFYFFVTVAAPVRAPGRRPLPPHSSPHPTARKRPVHPHFRLLATLRWTHLSVDPRSRYPVCTMP